MPVGGFVAKYMGDGVLAYFGYPQAQENDPERALRREWNAKHADLLARLSGLGFHEQMSIVDGEVRLPLDSFATLLDTIESKGRTT